MKKPLLVVLGMAALVLSIGWAVSADRPAAKSAVPAVSAAAKVAASRITQVTVYPNSALVTREVDTPAGTGTFELIVSPLPPLTVDSSLYSEGSDGIRVLSTRYRTRPIREDTREEVRKLEDEVRTLAFASQKLQSDLQAAEKNQHLFTKLEDFTANSNKTGDKTPLNSESIIALTKYVVESRAARAKEIVSLQQEIELNKEQAEFTRRQLRDLTAGTTKIEHDGVIVVDKVNAAAGKVRLNYLVGAASWRPQYKFRAGKGEKEAVQLEYLAAVLQHTGEDWSGVQLVLSTAQPTLNAAPPDLQVLQVRVVAPGGAAPVVSHNPNTMELEERVRTLRSQAQKDFNERKQSSGIGLFNTAAALDQSWELLNPEAAVKRGCSFASKEGPSVTYHLKTQLTVPSRNDEQIIEVAKIEMQPDYYYKAVPVLTAHIYRLADLTNKSNYVLLPGEATMYIGSDFVGQMNVPLVAIGEQFTAGFGVDPQLQIQRQMIDRSRTTQGGNQVLRYEYRILLSSYKSEKARLQVWDRLPFAENDTVGVSLTRTAPELCKDGIYLREQRPNNLLRWDVTVEPGMSGEKALPIHYEFKLDLDRQMTIGSFQTAGIVPPAPPTMVERTHAPTVPAMTGDQERIRTQMAKLSAEDRKLAETQVFCALDQESPLGSMGSIYKVMCKGTPVFLCCKGCEAEARANPDQTLAELNKLMTRMKSARK